MKFIQTQNTVSGKITYFFSNDGCFPVDEQTCSANALEAELQARQIDNVQLGLYALGNNRYGCYAESKAPVLH